MGLGKSEIKNLKDSIQKIRENINLSLGGGGSVLLDSAQTDKNYRVLVMNEDSSFSVLTDQNDIDLLPLMNLSGKTLAKGVLLKSPTNLNFKNITPSAGSVIAYL